VSGLAVPPAAGAPRVHSKEVVQPPRAWRSARNQHILASPFLPPFCTAKVRHSVYLEQTHPESGSYRLKAHQFGHRIHITRLYLLVRELNASNLDASNLDGRAKSVDNTRSHNVFVLVKFKVTVLAFRKKFFFSFFLV